VSRETSLLTFGIGPVHTFIAQARRIADVWAGSYLLSHLVRQAIGVVRQTTDERAHMVFPYLTKDQNIPDGLPNRFVCRVPRGEEDALARTMKAAVEKVWGMAAEAAVKTLREHGIEPSGDALRQTDQLLQIVWSWVPETDGYALAALEGARRYAAMRLFRPFPQVGERGEKCAICGERNALPDGDRRHVEKAWRAAHERAQDREKGLDRFLRFEQTRLCLVCTTKRLFTYLEERRRTRFLALDEFQPHENEPYIAVVKLDGDRMGSLLALGPDAMVGGDLETFHREVSQALSRFAEGLHLSDSPNLNPKALGSYVPVGHHPPQLLYAGGDDALFACDPRDALPVAALLRQRYHESFEAARQCLLHEEDRERLTMSGAIYFAHSGHPAGLLLNDLEELLKKEAKDQGGRDALAIRLEKRGGAPVDVVFPWKAQEGVDWPEAMKELVDLLRRGDLSSSQSFSLRLEERTLLEVFDQDEKRWQGWLTERLTRNVGTAPQAEALAERLVPFFVHRRTGALRISRFLGVEAERGGDRT
jgi:CRISPR-associated protein Cmr2